MQSELSHARSASQAMSARNFSEVRDWLRTDGLSWIFALKAALAAVLAAFIAMKLELPQPRTAIVTVFIVMRPHSGLVLARALYRISGTLVGVLMAMLLIAIFGQYPDLFIGSTALWIAICTAGAARNRNTRAYGFVLAGYTAAIVGSASLQDPNTAFMIASTRIAEIAVGIVCSSAVSALIFPVHAGDQVQEAIRIQSAAFLTYVAKTLPSSPAVYDVAAMHRQLVTSLTTFESLRVIAVLETHDMRMRARRMKRLSAELMRASTQYHVFLQLRDQLRASEDCAALAAVNRCLGRVPKLLSHAIEPFPTYEAATLAAQRLDRFRKRLRHRVAREEQNLGAATNTTSLNFSTVAEQLERFGSELSAYLHTYASLSHATHEREKWVEPLVPKSDALIALASGARAAVATMALGAFWIATAWPSGGTAFAQGAAICALSSTASDSSRLALQIALGTLVGAVVGTFIVFGIYTRIDGFPLLALTLMVATIPGAFVMTRSKLAGYGIGYCVFLPVLAGPDNPQSFLPETYLNDAIALVGAMFFAAVAQSVVLPVTSTWFHRRLTAKLKRQIYEAYDAPL
ncbi:FUSC family protein [Burkholderia multivorans]|uniref:FUSC family protein n=1 Tax=Burkholderia multivorans TaxID=87883 RepID=UPI0021C12F1E|nr:FUSC family protein [Burkholderia multivorans]